jgi:hypothetical protein
MIEPLCCVTRRLGRDALGSRAPLLESWLVGMLAKMCEYIEDFRRQYGDLQEGDGEPEESLPDAKHIVVALEHLNSEHAEAARSKLAAACGYDVSQALRTLSARLSAVAL